MYCSITHSLEIARRQVRIDSISKKAKSVLGFNLARLDRMPSLYHLHNHLSPVKPFLKSDQKPLGSTVRILKVFILVKENSVVPWQR